MLMSARLRKTTVTPMQSVSILLAHTAATVGLVTKEMDSYANVSAQCAVCESRISGSTVLIKSKKGWRSADCQA